MTSKKRTTRSLPEVKSPVDKTDIFTGEEHTESFVDDYRLSKQEWLVMHTTEDILLLMEDRGATKQQLADKMGKSKRYITSLLSGERDMTLRELCDIVYWLGGTATVNIKKH